MGSQWEAVARDRSSERQGAARDQSAMSQLWRLVARLVTTLWQGFGVEYFEDERTRMGNIHTVGPNQALIVSGGCCGSTSKKTVVGGWAWAWWLVTDVQRLSLEVMTLNPVCENVETAQGVPLTVTGVAQVTNNLGLNSSFWLGTGCIWSLSNWELNLSKEI